MLARLPATFTICSVSRYQTAADSDNSVLGALSPRPARQQGGVGLGWYHGHAEGTAGVFWYEKTLDVYNFGGAPCGVEKCVASECFVRLCDKTTSLDARGACAAWSTLNPRVQTLNLLISEPYTLQQGRAACEHQESLAGRRQAILNPNPSRTNTHTRAHFNSGH